MIPRNTLFSSFDNRAIQNIKLSPDARYISYVDMRKQSYGVWVREYDDPNIGFCVSGNVEGIVPYHSWISNDCLQFPIDTSGDLSISSVVYNVKTNRITTIRPESDVKRAQCIVCQITSYSADFCLIGDSSRHSKALDYYLVNLVTGDRELKFINDDFDQVLFDENYQPLVGMQRVPDGSLELVRFTEIGNSKLLQGVSIARVSFENSKAFQILELSKNSLSIYATCYEVELANGSSIGSRSGAKNVVEISLDHAIANKVCSDASIDVVSTLQSPLTGELQAVSRMENTLTWEVIDQSIQNDLDYLHRLATSVADPYAYCNILARTANDESWLVEVVSSAFSGAVYSYQKGHYKVRSLEMLNEPIRTSRAEEKLSSHQPTTRSHSRTQAKLPGRTHTLQRPGAHKTPVSIKARDGLLLPSYLTRPVNEKQPSTPLILLVHGGPGGVRDTIAYDPWHQLFSDRGCSVLSVNFRGSGGFGKGFEAAGHGEWGGKINDDLCDAAEWAVSEKITSPDRIGIMGYSFGGYAAMAAIAFSPNVFCCAVAQAPIIDVFAFATNFSETYKPYEKYLWRQMGDPNSAEGADSLKRISPINYIRSINTPLLYAIGEKDEPSQVSLADVLIDKLKAKGNYVDYLKFPDEGHVLVNPNNNLAYVSAVEQFMAMHLGFKAEPDHGELFNSSLNST